METLEYDRMLKVDLNDYPLEKISDFIKALKAERVKLGSQITEYRKNKVSPSYVKDVGKWYNGLCKGINAIDTVKFKAVCLYREKRDYPNGKCGTNTRCGMMGKQVLNEDWVFCPYCGSKLEK